MVDEEGKAADGHDEKLHPECVVITVVRGAEFVVHEENGEDGRTDEEELHARVVKRDEVGEQIQVATDEDNREHDLAFARHAYKNTETSLRNVCVCAQVDGWGTGFCNVRNFGPQFNITDAH